MLSGLKQSELLDQRLNIREGEVGTNQRGKLNTCLKGLWEFRKTGTAFEELKTKVIIKILENNTTTNLVLVGKTDLEKKNVLQ